MAKSAGLQRLVAYIAMFIIALVNVGMVTLLMYPGGWHKRMSLFYTLDIGLLRVTVGGGATGHALQLAAKGLSEQTRKTLANLDMQEVGVGDMCHRMCQLPSIGTIYCGVFDRLRVSSMLTLIFGWISVILHCMALGFMYYYWNVEARLVTRKWYLKFLIGAPVLMFVNLFQYVVATWELRSFPPQMDDGVTWGVCLMFAWMLNFVAVVPLVLTQVVAKKAAEEDLIEARANLKEAELDADVTARTAVQMREFSPGTGLAAATNYPSQQAQSSQPPAYALQPFNGADPYNQSYGSSPPSYGASPPMYGAAPGSWPGAAAPMQQPLAQYDYSQQQQPQYDYSQHAGMAPHSAGGNPYQQQHSAWG